MHVQVVAAHTVAETRHKQLDTTKYVNTHPPARRLDFTESTAAYELCAHRKKVIIIKIKSLPHLALFCELTENIDTIESMEPIGTGITRRCHKSKYTLGNNFKPLIIRCNDRNLSVRL